jgi:hypothetical protein
VPSTSKKANKTLGVVVDVGMGVGAGEQDLLSQRQWKTKKVPLCKYLEIACSASGRRITCTWY